MGVLPEYLSDDTMHKDCINGATFNPYSSKTMSRRKVSWVNFAQIHSTTRLVSGKIEQFKDRLKTHVSRLLHSGP